MAALPITIGDTAQLALVLADGDVTKRPLARIYRAGDLTPLETLALTHIAEGLYEGSYLPVIIGTYNVVYTVYDDAGHTIPSTKYSKELDQLLVTVGGGSGVTEQNQFIDNTVYDNCCQVVSSRLRVYDTAAHCNAATDGGNEIIGLVATYQITVDYRGPAKMKTYRKVRL